MAESQHSHFREEFSQALDDIYEAWCSTMSIISLQKKFKKRGKQGKTASKLDEALKSMFQQLDTSTAAVDLRKEEVDNQEILTFLHQFTDLEEALKDQGDLVGAKNLQGVSNFVEKLVSELACNCGKNNG